MRSISLFTLLALSGCAWISSSDYDERIDDDDDGHLSAALGGDDCDDHDGTVYPGAVEVCDAVDNNCDGMLYPCVSGPSDATITLAATGQRARFSAALTVGQVDGGPGAIVGAPGANMGGGEVFLMALVAGTTTTDNAVTRLRGAPQSMLGQAVSTVPDPFGVFAGQPEFDAALLFRNPNSGDVGDVDGLSLLPNLAALSGVLDDAGEFGHAISSFRVPSVGGQAGVAVGAPSAMLGTTVLGGVFVYAGGQEPPDWEVPTQVVVGEADSGVGEAAAIGEWDGDDTVVDLVVGAPGLQTVGVFFGAGVGTAFSSANFTATGPENSNFGASVGVARVLANAADELIVSDPLADGGAGAIYVFDGDAVQDGATASFQSAAITVRGSSAGEGVATFAVGDFNGDDIPDLAVGAPMWEDGAGAAYLFLGPLESQDTEEADFSFFGVTSDEGANDGDRVGASLAFIDVDDDDLEELLIGAPGIDAEDAEDAGAVYGFWGVAEIEE